MKKMMVVMSVATLLFTSCGLINDLKEVFNASDVKMAPVDIAIDVVTPGDFNPATNPACTLLASYSFDFDMYMEADNSANEGTAQIGTVEMDLVPDTVGASAIPLTGAGTRLSGGEVDTLMYSGSVDGGDASQRIGLRYMATQIVNSQDITVFTSGSYTVEVGDNDISIPVPEDTMSFAPVVDPTTRSVLNLALDHGVFD